LDKETRSHHGVFYTPPALAAWMARRALPEATPEPPRVLDPACGAGALLVAARQRLQALHPDLAPRELASCLHGVDLDPDGVEQARRAVGPGVRIHLADALLDPVGEGYDVVLGNPPYVRQERLGDRKEHLRRRYATFSGTSDLYVCFFERGLQLLRPGGRLVFLVSNKWLRVTYGAALRELLAREAWLEEVVDLGHAPVFGTTDAFPSLVVLRRPEEGEGPDTVAVRPPVPGVHDPERLPVHRVARRRLGRAPWCLEPEAVQQALEKLTDRGTPLGQVLPGPPRRGVLTGLNAAFVVDRATRDALVAADPRSAEVLRRVARGRDLSRWSVSPPEQWLLFLRRGLDLGAYPAVRAHLERFRERLTPREPGRAGPGRKPGTYAWYELQDTTAYWRLFEGPKIVHTDITWRPGFALSPGPLFLLNTAYAWPCADHYVLAVVNSPVMWCWMWRYAAHGKDEALRLVRGFVERLPIPDASGSLQREIGESVAALIEGAAPQQRPALEARIAAGVERAFGLQEDDVAVLRASAPPRTPVWGI